MSAKRFALWAAAALLVMFIAANLTSNSWFRSWRLDLTQNQLYSLSPGTREVLANLSEPVELTFYYSSDVAARSPQVQAYGARVREMLQSFAARSRGRVRFVSVDVKRYTDEEDQAVEAGVEPISIGQGGDPLYMGLSGANAIDDRRTIPFFDPQREAFLEYEITRLIYELENPDPTKVVLITSLPFDPAQASAGLNAQPAFITEMGRLMDVAKLAPDFAEIPADADVLAIIHPYPLTEVQAFAVDQFILRKGRAFIALDPASMAAMQMGGQAMFDPMSAAPNSSSLEPLLSNWGVALSRDVVMDLGGALPVRAQRPDGRAEEVPQPLFFAVPKDGLDSADLMTAWLNRGVNFGMAGSLSWSEREGVTATRLAQTTAETARLPSERALMRPTPYELLRDWRQGAGRIETIALRLSGNLSTAFPNGPPEGAPPAADGSARLTASAAPAQLVIVADTDFLADDFYVTPQGAAFADNGAFALNAIDVLDGSDALVSLRSRAPSLRPMTRVDEMETQARRRIEQRQDVLQTQLQQTESRLAELQARGRGSGFFAGDLGAELTAEERTEIDRFRNQMVEVRAELRELERNLRSDINSLQTLVVFVNVWLAPLLVAGAGLFLFWRRHRRGRGGGAKP